MPITTSKEPLAVVAFCTASSPDEARKIARSLVEQHLVACANIVPAIQSFYWWKGEVCADNEALIMMKTMPDKIPALRTALPKLHSYDVPELIIVDINDGLPAYLEWVEASTR